MPADIDKILPTKTIPAKYSKLENLDIGLDVIAIIIWLTLAVFYSVSIARKRGPVLLLATYAGLAVTAVVSQLNLAPAGALQNWQNGEYFLLSVFLITLVLAFVSLIRAIRSHTRLPHATGGILIVGALEVGAMLATVGSLLPPDLQKQITGFAGLLFTAPWTLVLWLILPLIVFLITDYRERSVLKNL